jgi:RNA polymerase sigma factor (TIGR02999 family)
MTSDHSLTQQLQNYFQNGQGDADAILMQVLPGLHRIAVRELKKERVAVPVSPTELIQEIWIRNLSKAAWQVQNRDHFYAIASLAMRRVLVDLARKRLAQRRGGEEPLRLYEADLEKHVMPDAWRIVEIGILMERLEGHDADAARVVDMHYFGGFTLKEISETTMLSFRQVRLRWERGLRWLRTNLETATGKPVLRNLSKNAQRVPVLHDLSNSARA